MKSDRIYIPKKPRYGLDRPHYDWPGLIALLVICAGLCALIWWRL